MPDEAPVTMTKGRIEDMVVLQKRGAINKENASAATPASQPILENCIQRGVRQGRLWVPE